MTQYKSTVLTLLLIFASFYGAVKAEPILSIPNVKFDFGYVPQHAKVSHDFWLYSTGTDTLKILEIRPGCSCTKAPLEKNEIAPGDSTRLEIYYSTKTFRGKQAKRPKIDSNADASERVITITANVMMFPDSTYPVVLRPAKLKMVKFDENPADKSEVTINNRSDEDLELKMVEYPENLLKVKLPKKIKAGKTDEIKIEIEKDFVDTEFERSITFDVIGKETTRYTIPIKRGLRNMSANN